MEGTLAEIRMFAGTFAPRGWQLCNGQLLSIAQWTAVFALVGTTYGGNGQTTFGLPDFRGRMALGTGTGPGLPSIQLGEMAGVENTTLLLTNLPFHNHTIGGTLNIRAAGDGVLGTDPGNRYVGPASFYSGDTHDLVNMAPATGSLSTAPSGGNQPFNNRMPYTGINFIFCVEGIFPSRD
jgi:microcystin-dependent protein